MSAAIDVATGGAARRKVRACRVCAIAKAKCVPREGQTDGPCARCYRLGKDCSGQTSSTKHVRRKHTRIEQLEQKVDSLLAAQPWQATDRPSPAGPPAAYPAMQPDLTRQIVATAAPVLCSAPPDYATDPLEIFQSELAQHCPWVIISLGTTFAELSQRKPFLFLSICVAAFYRDPPRQRELGRKFREHLASQLLPRGEKSFDLLQGLLVAINWYQFHMGVSVHLTNLLHLAMAQAVELGLGRRTHSNDRQRPAISGLRVVPSEEESCQNQQHSLDGTRAYLGCFYFSSVISICIKKMDPMLWNQRMEECCRLLADQNERPSDTYLLYQVRLHQIAGRIGQTLPFDGPDIHPAASLQPIRMCVKSFQRDLQDFKMSSLDTMAETGWSTSLRMKFHVVGMYLHEIGFQISNKDDDSLLRPELLYNCLLSSKSFFDTLFSMPATTFITYTYVPWAHLIHALAVLSKLSLLEEPDWDLVQVRQTLDFAVVVDGVLALIKELEAEMIQPRDALRFGMLARIASQMVHLKERYFCRLGILERRLASPPGAISVLTQVQDVGLHDKFFEGLDESFWQDIFVDWNAFPDPGQEHASQIDACEARSHM